jgi:hypothetical protein
MPIMQALLKYKQDNFAVLIVEFVDIKNLAKLIQSSHTTIVVYIKNKTLFRGEWYFSNLPFNLTETPLISDWSSFESNNLILNIISNSHIKKAIFVYDSNNNFIRKFDGITHACPTK